MWKGRHHSKLWPYGIGEPFDLRTFRGCWLALLFFCAATYFLWHTRDLYVWWDNLWGVESKIDLTAQKWVRVWAVIIGGVGILTPIVAMIMIPINRRRTPEIVNDPLCDTQTWKREERSDANPEMTSEPVHPEQSEPPAEGPLWNDEPQEPTGIRPPTNAEPPNGSVMFDWRKTTIERL